MCYNRISGQKTAERSIGVTTESFHSDSKLFLVLLDALRATKNILR